MTKKPNEPNFEAKKYVIASIFVTEDGDFGARWYGHVAEQGGIREGSDLFLTSTLEGALEYVTALMTDSRRGEEFYKRVLFEAMERKKAEQSEEDTTG